MDKIVKALASFYENIKAESIVLELQDNTALVDGFLIENKGTFKRGYRRDVLNFKKKEAKLLLELSRDGIYDSLPEGFFHKNTSSEDYISERKIKKKEEKDSRLLFGPIENELFNQRLNIEKQERQLFDDFYNLGDDFFLKFWDLKDSLDNKYVFKLVKLLPHCHQIAGDLALIKLCLQRILNEKVTLIKTFENHQINHDDDSQVLGISFVSKTNTSNVGVPHVVFKIGPVLSSRLDKYYENTEITDFLKIFYSYFLPLELQAETRFFCDTKEAFILKQDRAPIMGVSTKI